MAALNICELFCPGSWCRPVSDSCDRRLCNSNSVPHGDEKVATTRQTCQSENAEFAPNRNSVGGLILGPAGDRIRLYRQHAAVCNSVDAATCEGKAYLVPGNVVEVGIACGDYVRVRYVGKSRISWVEKKSLGESQAPEQ